MSESNEFQEVATGLAVAGAAEAVSTSEAAADTAAASAVVAAESLATSEAAAESAVVAAETATVAHEEAEQATQAVAQVAEGTVSLLDQIRGEFRDELDKLRQEIATKPQPQSEEEEPVSEVAPVEIPVANEFHAEGGELADDKPRSSRHHRFGRRS